MTVPLTTPLKLGAPEPVPLAVKSELSSTCALTSSDRSRSTPPLMLTPQPLFAPFDVNHALTMVSPFRAPAASLMLSAVAWNPCSVS